MKLLNSSMKAILCTGFVGIALSTATAANAKSSAGADFDRMVNSEAAGAEFDKLTKRSYGKNYRMKGDYKVTLSAGGRSLNCRSRASLNSSVRTKFYKGDVIHVTSVVGKSSPWLKTFEGCYVRGNSKYVTFLGK